MGLSIAAHPRLDDVAVAKVRDVIHAASSHDDLAPLSEHVLFHLRHGSDGTDEHLVASIDGETVGYLHLDRTDAVAGPAVELVVHPAHRRTGVGTALVRAAIGRSSDPRLRLWAHGELAAAYHLASALGFTKARELWQLRRSLHATLPRVDDADGVVITPFVPGRDEAGWLALNSQVFAEHPEQGRFDQRDLELRMGESWFDPRGFLIAWRGARMVGFHWVKVQGGVGEIYVLGVAPDERGTGLGRVLAVRGLEYMRSLDLGAAMLYVDADNQPARALYESLGFLHWDTDVMFART